MKNPKIPNPILKRLGLWTKKELQAVLDEEMEIQKNHTYYTITNQEKLREEKIRYLKFIFWKIFTR